MSVAECPECAHHLIANPHWKVGYVFECPECATMLEVLALEPLTLERAPQE